MTLNQTLFPVLRATRRKLAFLSLGLLLTGFHSPALADDLDNTLRDTKKNLSDDILKSVTGELDEHLTWIRDVRNRVNEFVDAGKRVPQWLHELYTRAEEELQQRVLGQPTGARPTPLSSVEPPRQEPVVSRNRTPVQATQRRPTYRPTSTSFSLPRRPYNPQDFSGAYNPPQTLKPTSSGAPHSPRRSPRIEYNDAMPKPSVKPKGVLMRLGIDPSTYEKSQAPASLLDRIGRSS